MDPQWTMAYTSIAQIVVGLFQCVLIWYGLRLMAKASAQRDRQLDELGRVLTQRDRQLDAQSEALTEVARGIRELLQQSQPQA